MSCSRCSHCFRFSMHQRVHHSTVCVTITLSTILQLLAFLIVKFTFFKSPSSFVFQVAPRSPAARIGLRAGDVITEIGDLESSNLTQQDALDALAQYGLSLILTVERFVLLNILGFGAIHVLRNTFFWKFDTHLRARNASNVEWYIFEMHFSGKSDTLSPPLALRNT